MSEQTVRTKELIKSGMSEDEVIEQLIIDGYFGDTGDIRRYLKPVVRKIANMTKWEEESR